MSIPHSSASRVGLVQLSIDSPHEKILAAWEHPTAVLEWKKVILGKSGKSRTRQILYTKVHTPMLMRNLYSNTSIDFLSISQREAFTSASALADFLWDFRRGRVTLTIKQGSDGCFFGSPILKAMPSSSCSAFQLKAKTMASDLELSLESAESTSQIKMGNTEVIKREVAPVTRTPVESPVDASNAAFHFGMEQDTPLKVVTPLRIGSGSNRMTKKRSSSPKCEVLSAFGLFHQAKVLAVSSKRRRFSFRDMLYRGEIES